MNSKYEDFIGIYDDVYPEGFCAHLIANFDRLEKDSVGGSRQQTERANRHVKDDYQIMINGRHVWLSPFQDKNPEHIFFDGLQHCYNEYTEKYSVLKDNNIRGDAMKMQRTAPGSGYHVWHGEQGSFSTSSANRVLVYMLYLNTLPLDNAGETEFLYQQRRYNPIENRMIVWPAAYTHAHRGNTVFGEQSKYVVTGWFYYD